MGKERAKDVKRAWLLCYAESIRPARVGFEDRPQFQWA
jgi:hypothetical protein